MASAGLQARAATLTHRHGPVTSGHTMHQNGDPPAAVAWANPNFQAPVSSRMKPPRMKETLTILGRTCPQLGTFHMCQFLGAGPLGPMDMRGLQRLCRGGPIEDSLDFVHLGHKG